MGALSGDHSFLKNCDGRKHQPADKSAPQAQHHGFGLRASQPPRPRTSCASAGKQQSCLVDRTLQRHSHPVDNAIRESVRVQRGIGNLIKAGHEQAPFRILFRWQNSRCSKAFGSADRLT
jgi:hypothetical protein